MAQPRRKKGVTGSTQLLNGSEATDFNVHCGLLSWNQSLRFLACTELGRSSENAETPSPQRARRELIRSEHE